MNTKEYLAFTAQHSPIDRFVLKHGRPFEIGPKTYEGKRMEAGLCFMNATLMAIDNSKLKYVEGYACVHGVALQHAWVVDENGFIIDPTWSETNPEKRIHSDYFGVEFSTRYLKRATLLNGYYGLLDPYYAKETIEKLIKGRSKFR